MSAGERPTGPVVATGTATDGTREPRFAVALTCIDGRIQDQVQSGLRERWGVDHVDVVTVPAPELSVAGAETGHPLWAALAISVRAHGATQVAVVAHTDCAATTVEPADLPEQVALAVEAVRRRHPDLEVSGLVAPTGEDRLVVVESGAEVGPA